MVNQTVSIATCELEACSYSAMWGPRLKVMLRMVEWRREKRVLDGPIELGNQLTQNFSHCWASSPES